MEKKLKITSINDVDVEEIAKRIFAKEMTNDERNIWLTSLAWKSLQEEERNQYYKRAKTAIKRAQEALKKEWQQCLY